MAGIRILRKIFQKEPVSAEERVRRVAHDLVWKSWRQAFKLFRDRKFRELTNFKNLEQVEQDRIFNELSVTAILLIIFTLEAPDLRVGPDFRELIAYLKDEIPKAHIDQLRKLGLEEKYLEIWHKLLDMRYEEYQKDKHKVREAAMEIRSQQAMLTNDDLNTIQLGLPVETLAIGALFHIRRGKNNPEDSLFKMLLDWLGWFYLDVRLSTEGVKIPWWKKIWVNTRRRLRSILLV